MEESDDIIFEEITLDEFGKMIESVFAVQQVPCHSKTDIYDTHASWVKV